MATLVHTATTSGTDIAPSTLSAMPSNGNTPEQTVNSSTRSTRKIKHCHVFATHSQQRTSCLTQGAETPSFLGFRNLMILVLIVSNLRLMIENFRKYGVLICIRCHDYRRDDVKYGLLLYLSVPCHLFIAYMIELAAAQQAKSAVARMKKAGEEQNTPEKVAAARRSFNWSWRIIAFLHGVNSSANLLIATHVVYNRIHHPGIGTLCEMHAIIVWLKTASYAFTNRDLRHALLHPDQSEPLPEIYASCPYPRNINWKNLCYFWWAPTLVYQPVYPRTERIRWMFVAKRLLEVAGLSIVIWIASAQYAAPLLQNSLDKMFTLDFVSIVERVMKLSTISLFCWLCGFFALFQSFMNALAEVMRFGDREFYGDWWNVSSVRAYWTTWNKPVTNFMRRHIYNSLVRRGWPAMYAQVAVFVLSGILHELLVGVPTHNILGVAFAGMMIQIPLIFLTDVIQKMKGMGGEVMGNMIFWISFCLVGQPLAALLYFFAWQAKYGSVSKQYQESPALQFFVRR
ncbi:diacylglycerol O-acyltransferase [Trematosphaeria pertusa]|uniref:O-acyltransferase n=1 Tax=Trematosphaeria pertusa TaxID=390896 RepID=A0A6A6IDM2_9PLEO|nr:diacylglycerol O-acyltransferase [Trematosphaeria pertusa]KAF2248158.1 diacylglycerol O-acyltransferase [Trematosphaeria pertusa]